ncbi:MAG TPA: hypothetical protein VFL82_12370 [Thermomicrobiales bacterium]|jgi:hypothetical protein|nr:hypothetical protein [Thermomicrobiales bacterium]
MSLHDQYNRTIGPDEGRLVLLDRYLTYLGDRAGNYWRDHTGISRALLTQGLYVFAAWAAMQHLMIVHDPTMLVIVGISLLALVGIKPARGTVVEQMQIEALGLPRRTFVLLRLWLLSLGLLSLAIALGDFAASIQSGTPMPPNTIQSWLLGCALTAWQVSDYISRTNPTWPSRGLRQRS